MPDPLDDYRKKRDFLRTPEPMPSAPAVERGSRIFVVHRHEARNLHYDLRLETVGVLRSWAVPRGFSYDPGDKRLAVMTEDHPLAYEHFDGRIPKGQYGAGTMTIWDRGRYDLLHVPDVAAAMAAGEIKLRFYGRRLRGEWHLVKTNQGKNSWLLFKSKDRYAGTSRDSALGIDLVAAVEAEMAVEPAPMLCSGEREVFTDPSWLFEMEFAGMRCCAVKRGDTAAVLGVNVPLPAIQQDLLQLRCDQACLDGVLVALDDRQRPSREALAACLAAGRGDGVFFYAFDLLHWEEYDLRPLPLLDRKAALRSVVGKTAHVLYVDHVAGSGPQLLTAILEAGLPAAIGKRGSSSYTAGPSTDWVRIPATASAAAVAAAPTPKSAASKQRARVQPSNLDKVYWPAEGYTKGDLLAYYETVADFLLPHLHDRPVHLNRFPDGIDGKSFYQREAKPGTPSWLRTVPIAGDDGDVPHHVIDDRDALRYAINLGSIDLHPWLSRVGHLDEPDYAVLDLDPKGAPFADVLRIARAAGKLLRGVGLRPLLKTSGKQGMHVFVPLQRGYSYDHARMFTEAVARVLLRDLADVATVERRPDQRDGKVYLDCLQNRRSQTVVPPYVVRPVRGATVSAPLQWDELEETGLQPQNFTIHTMPARLLARGDLFRRALDDGQDLLPAISALQEVLRGR
jgi:bifunctional non-homologous end joining protein LigD